MANAQNTDNPIDPMLLAFQNAIQVGLKTAIAARYEEIKKEFLENLESEKATIIAGVSLDIMKIVDMERSGQIIRISIKDKNQDGKN